MEPTPTPEPTGARAVADAWPLHGVTVPVQRQPEDTPRPGYEPVEPTDPAPAWGPARPAATYPTDWSNVDRQSYVQQAGEPQPPAYGRAAAAFGHSRDGGGWGRRALDDDAPAVGNPWDATPADAGPGAPPDRQAADQDAEDRHAEDQHAADQQTGSGVPASPAEYDRNGYQPAAPERDTEAPQAEPRDAEDRYAEDRDADPRDAEVGHAEVRNADARDDAEDWRGPDHAGAGSAAPDAPFAEPTGFPGPAEFAQPDERPAAWSAGGRADGAGEPDAQPATDHSDAYAGHGDPADDPAAYGEPDGPAVVEVTLVPTVEQPSAGSPAAEREEPEQVQIATGQQNAPEPVTDWSGSTAADPDGMAQRQPEPVPLRPGDVPETRLIVWQEETSERFRTEWHEVKALFVDEPVQALHRAKELVTDAVNEVHMALILKQEGMDPLADSELPDTETMRVAMRRYREFLDRILDL